MTNILNNNKVNLGQLHGKTIAIIGYGPQGKAQSYNLKKSGFNVVVGLRENSKNFQIAKSDGHNVMSIEKAVEESDIIHILVSDSVQSDVYTKYIMHNLTESKTLSFSHAASIYWRWIEPPKNIDVILVAPKTTSQELMCQYNHGNMVFAVSVFQNYTNKAQEKAISLASAIGGKNSKILQISFKEEVLVNWFAEQSVLCGGVTNMITNAFEVLTEAGYQPEIAYFEVLHELKLIVDMIQRHGITGMYTRVSETARYGGLTRGPFVMDHHVKENMKKVLADNENGNFEAELIKQHQNVTCLKKLISEIESSKIEIVGKEMRKLVYGEKHLDDEINPEKLSIHLK